MTKRSWLKVVVPMMVLGGVAAVTMRSSVSRAQTTPAPTCVSVTYPYGASPNPQPSFTLVYDTTNGVTLTGANLNVGVPNQISGTIPKTIDGKPNPDFDRLYALLMKGIDGQLISGVCVLGQSGTGAITSVTLKSGTGGQRVQVCEGALCAHVSTAGFLFTTN
ncbi:MAG TPA: hypothetical protein VHJ20_13350 [Polyangia bacterium]|nr:hypothetical protein [Polyangia bacterium]